MSSDRICWCLFAWLCAVVSGCASTVDGSHAVPSAMEAGVPFDAGMIDDVPAPCTAPTMTCGTGAAPRPIAPLSTATTTSQQPTLHWALAAGTDGAVVQVCHDRACTIVEQTLAATGSSAAPATSLAPGVHFWRLFGTHGTTRGTVAGPTWQFFVGHRSAPVDTSYGGVLDVNGDGYADVAIADSSGAAHLYLGSASGLDAFPNAWPGGAVNVASVGDVNGDGYADLAVGSNLYFGSSSGLGTSATVLPGIDGVTVAGAGDVNGDGYADVVAGSETSGAPYLFLGSASGLGSPISLASPGIGSDDMAVKVAGAGDISGDGYADFVVIFSTGTAGSTYVYMGSASGPSATPTVLTGPGGDSVGTVAGALDVNGDGYSDLVVFTDDEMIGIVSVFAGSASGLARVPTTLNPSPGGNVTLASAGDVNGDGFTDLLVGVDNVPQAIVYLGSASGLGDPVMLTVMRTEGADGSDPSEFGWAVAGAGDVNGDGYADVVVGDPGAGSLIVVGSGPGTLPGAAYVYLGRATGLDTTAIVLAAPANVSYFGESVALGW